MGILEALGPIGSVAQGIGGIASAYGNYQAQVETNKQNKALQEEEWRREDTAMQRKVKDLTAAGLNPVLAAGGTGSPTSLTTKMQAPQFDMPDLSKALSMAMFESQFKTAENGVEISRQEANVKAQEAVNASLTGDVLQARSEKANTIVDNEIKKQQAEINFINSQRSSTEANRVLTEKETEYYDSNQISGILSKVGGLIPGVSTLLDILRGSKLPMPIRRAK